MTTQTSYSDRGRLRSLLGNKLRGNLPFGMISAIISIIILPVIYFGTEYYTLWNHVVADRPLDDDWLLNYFSAGAHIDSGFSLMAHGLLMVLALVSALVSNGYLHSRRMTDFYHALPLRRPQLLCANITSGVGAILFPYYAMYLLTMAAQLISFGKYGLFDSVYFALCFFDVASVTLSVVMVYLFCALISVNVGTTLDSFAITGAIGSIPLIVGLIISNVFNEHVYGAYHSIERIILLLSPLTYPLQTFFYYGETAKRIAHLLAGIGISAALYFLARFFYNRRKSEIAEMTNGGGPLQTAVKCAGAFSGGTVFYLIFEPRSVAALVFYLMLGSTMAGLVAELIMSRGVALILKNIGWVLGTGAVASVLFLAVQFDWMNYAGYQPKLEQIASVTTNYNGRFEEQGVWFGNDTTYTDPESIAIIFDSHRLALENRPLDGANFYGSYNIDDYSRGLLNITYTLKSGRRIERRYYQYYVPALIELSALDTREDFIRQNSALFRLEETGRERFTLYDSFHNEGSTLSLSAERQKQLMEALRTDMLAETLPGIQNPSMPAYGYLTIEYDNTRYLDTTTTVVENTDSRLWFEYDASYERVQVLLSHEFTNTIALLREWGYAERLGKERENFDKISLWLNPDRASNIYEKVQTIDANTRENYLGRSMPDEREGIEFFPVEDTTLYGSLYQLAQDRVMVTEKDLWSGNLLYIVFEKDNIVTGVKFIWKDRLPPELTEQYFSGEEPMSESPS